MARFPGVTLVHPPGVAELGAALAGAEILIVSNRAYVAEPAQVIRQHGSSLRWIQFSTSGIDNAIMHGLPAGVTVTNVAGLRAFSVAEHAFSLLLALVRQVRAAEAARPARDWARDVLTPLMDNLAGKHLAIIGVGAISEEIARKAKAFDMTVSGISRRSDLPANFDRMYPREDMLSAVAAADVVCLAAMQTADTGTLVDARVIAAMKPSALFINIARGSLVEEAALVDALAHKRLAGAGLDVTTIEPLPAESPLWSMPHVILSPHVAGAGSPGTNSLGQIFADNLERWLAGQPLKKIVIEKTT